MTDPTGLIEELLTAGRAAFEQGDYREAREQFAQAHLRAPADPRTRFWLGVTQYHLGRIPQAQKHLESLKDEAPPLPERPGAVLEYLARCCVSSDPKEAARLAEHGLRLDPDDPRLQLIAGNAYNRLGDRARALTHYDLGWAAEGGRHGKPAFPRHPGQVPYARATVLSELGRWDDARAAIDDALAREPDNGAYHYRRGLIMLDGLREPDDAEASAREAIAADPGTQATGFDGSYYFLLARCLHALGRREEAVAALERAIRISPARAYRDLRDDLVAAMPPTPAAPAGTAPAPAGSPGGFAAVGGMHGLKEQIRRVMRVVLTDRDDARRYGIVKNGILLYGPPGCGKTFFAQAIAAEFGLRYLRVPLGAALTKYVGAAAEAVERVFTDARTHTPCLLFFDEFDALVPRRSEAGTALEQQTVNALLQQFDAHRDVPGLVLAAATNRLHELDPAAIREGRFDFKVKIYRPDFDARREILAVLLADRPHDDTLDLAHWAQRTEGFSAAQLRHLVDAAAVSAMEAHAPISAGHVESALQERLADTRFGGKRLDWDDLILPEPVKRELQFIERFIEHPEVVEELGVEPPTGILLHGPPGTGKTTIARVLASQTDAAFFAVNAADIFSRWLGDSEQKMRDMFEQARDQVPAIVFIDEIESILGTRTGGSGGDRAATAVVNTFLSEMDGLEPNTRVFVIGATNRPDLVDDAVRRPGRLGEVIEVGLPDAECRLKMLELFSARMRLDPSVDLATLAGALEGASGADLRGLCTTAGRHALLRTLDEQGGERAVTQADFLAARDEVFPEGAREKTKEIGFGR
ncbi:MAG TPA: AAA family ATPase [Gemmatimonadales bacterium]